MLEKQEHLDCSEYFSINVAAAPLPLKNKNNKKKKNNKILCRFLFYYFPLCQNIFQNQPVSFHKRSLSLKCFFLFFVFFNYIIIIYYIFLWYFAMSMLGRKPASVHYLLWKPQPAASTRHFSWKGYRTWSTLIEEHLLQMSQFESCLDRKRLQLQLDVNSACPTFAVCILVLTVSISA